MGVEDIDAPDAPEWLAYDALTTKVLMQDPTLKRLGVTFKIWDGSPLDQAGPTIAQLPCVYVFPSPSGSSWFTNNQHTSTLVITLQCCVRGTSVRNLYKLWNAVHSAIFPPQGSPQRTHVQTVLWPNIRGISPVQGAIQGQVTDSAARMLVGEGKVSLTVDVNA